MKPDRRDALFKAHEELVQMAKEIGMDLPSLENEATTNASIGTGGSRHRVFSFSKISETLNQGDRSADRDTLNGIPAEKAAKIAAAEEEFEEHDAEALLVDRSEWLWFSIPETPVAGAHCAVYFNKGVSEALKFRPNVQMIRAFNEWELDNQTFPLRPVTEPNEDGSHWWTCEFRVPEQSYEMNFVFTDGEGAFDNNYGQDFLCPVHWGITRDEWLDGANARAAAVMEKRLGAEKAAEEVSRQSQMKQYEKEDREKAQWRIGELKSNLYNWQHGKINFQNAF